MNFHMTLESRNEKTGPIPVSTTSYDTCPDVCPLKGNGCYADGGPLGMHWRAVSEGKRGTTFDAFLAEVAALPEGQLWRHNQAGDLPGHGNDIDALALAELVNANRGKRGFTYTHKPVTENAPNQNAVEAANRDGFTINLSANSPAHADELASLGIAPVVTVLPADIDGAATKTLQTPAGRTITVCPATYRDDVTCASCWLCQRQKRKTIVGFPAHGASKRKASAVASA
jgi:hypothetical protein